MKSAVIPISQLPSRGSEFAAPSSLLPAVTCPKCSYKFALDEALNRDIELQVRKQLSDEFKKKEGELRRQLSKEASEKAERNSAELQIKLEAQARELKEARDNERALLRKKGRPSGAGGESGARSAAQVS
jgi:hypothetical protein